jgi:hypothetical protein
MKIWESKPPRTLWAITGHVTGRLLLRAHSTLTCMKWFQRLLVVPYRNVSHLEFRAIFDDSRAGGRAPKWRVVTPVTLRHSETPLSTNYLVYVSYSANCFVTVYWMFQRHSVLQVTRTVQLIVYYPSPFTVNKYYVSNLIRSLVNCSCLSLNRHWAEVLWFLAVKTTFLLVSYKMNNAVL